MVGIRTPRFSRGVHSSIGAERTLARRDDHRPRDFGEHGQDDLASGRETRHPPQPVRQVGEDGRAGGGAGALLGYAALFFALGAWRFHRD